MTETRKKPRSAAKRTSSSTRKAKADHTTRNWGIGTGLLAAAAVGVAVLMRDRIAALLGSRDGHPAPDLAADAGRPGEERAPDHFRPDPTAVPTADEREALRPATGPSPSLVADQGEMRSQTGTGSAREDIAVATEPA